jgi:hypothetical protein
MVTRTQVSKLSAQVDRVCDALVSKQPRRFAWVIQEVGETEAQAIARHIVSRPEDREASGYIIFRIVDPPSASGAQRVLGSSKTCR